jgi:predicted DNA-binding transcriptional regulator AlpA
MDNENEYLSAEQLAKKLSVSPKSVRKWTQKRKLPGVVRLGKRCIRYRLVDIEKRLLSGELLLDGK